MDLLPPKSSIKKDLKSKFFQDIKCVKFLRIWVKCSYEHTLFVDISIPVDLLCCFGFVCCIGELVVNGCKSSDYICRLNEIKAKPE